MKWIETKNVNLINLENVCRILSDEKKYFSVFHPVNIVTKNLIPKRMQKHDWKN